MIIKICCVKRRVSLFMNKMTITIVETNSITFCPPDINLIENLLNNNHNVNLISNEINLLKNDILKHQNFKGFELDSLPRNGGVINRILSRIKQAKKCRELVRKSMKNSDILWTTSEQSVRDLGDLVLEYKHVFQLMELTYKGDYCLNRLFTFDLSKIAQHAWKVVVPEINRAYIMKTWFDLKKTPYLLPNKPYSLNIGEITGDMLHGLEKMKNEKRKIVLYLGGIWPDRDLEPVAKALSRMNDEYILYIIGKAYGKNSQQKLKELMGEYPIEYLGSFTPPKHLHFVKYAHIGLLAYRPEKNRDLGVELNALYCAPNKIYEYAAYGVPMIGSDVLGLRYAFEKFGIGAIYEDNSDLSIECAIKNIERDYKNLHERCYDFYNDCDLDAIVKRILYDN